MFRIRQIDIHAVASNHMNVVLKGCPPPFAEEEQNLPKNKSSPGTTKVGMDQKQANPSFLGPLDLCTHPDEVARFQALTFQQNPQKNLTKGCKFAVATSKINRYDYKEFEVKI